jgi:hypothetical protein
MCSGLTLLVTLHLDAQSPNPMALVGSWQLTFTPNNAAVASSIAVVPGLATFTASGSVVETDGTEVIPLRIAATPAVYGTPGHGIWQAGPAIGRFFVQFVSFLVNQNATLHAKRTVTIRAS